MRRKQPLAAKVPPVRNAPQSVTKGRKQTWKACTPSEGKGRLWARSWPQSTWRPQRGRR
jgi:hypothetical protein